MAVIASTQLDTQEYTLGSRLSLEVLSWQIVASAFTSSATFIVAQKTLCGVSGVALAGSNETGTDGDLRVYNAFYEDGVVSAITDFVEIGSMSLDDGQLNRAAGICSTANMNTLYAMDPVPPVIVLTAELDDVGAGSGLLTARLLLYRG